jgi:hypothetical protein
MKPDSSQENFTAWRHREDILEAFETAWKAGAAPDIADFLPADPAQRRLALVELVRADLEFRRKAGRPARLADYLDRFPELRAEITALAELESHPPGIADTTISDPGPPSSPGSAGWPALDRYQISAEVGEGGMGVVYRARDLGLDREVALKTLGVRFAGHPAARQRFVVEAKITGQLQHPGIPAVHELGTLSDGRPFLAMKLVKGQTLRALLQERADPVQERGRFVAIFEQICQALGYAHAHRVIHRDLKPGNVMVGAHGEVQVLDWGLAKVLCAPGDATVADDPKSAREQGTAIATPEAAGSETETGAVRARRPTCRPNRPAARFGSSMHAATSSAWGQSCARS